MPTLKTTEIRTLSTYAREVASEPDELKWFRGVSSSAHALVPSLYRHPTVTTSEQLLALETSLITRFRERAQPMVSRALPVDRLELLFLMQHHGMPTRLLDWSENAFVALFFALSNLRRDTAGVAVGSSCVWRLKPTLWNRTVHAHINYPGEPFSVGDSRLTNGYVQVGDGATLMDRPVAVYGVHNSPRIVSQRGVFTFFGRSLEPMENVFAAGAFDETALYKIEIRGAHQDVVFRELLGAGVLESTVFPDLDGLARELKRSAGFGV